MSMRLWAVRGAIICALVALIFIQHGHSEMGAWLRAQLTPDKMFHASACFLLTLAGLYAFPGLRAIWIALAVCAVGLALEITQIWTDRNADIADVVFNTVGAGLALVAVLAGHFRAAQRRRRAR